MKRYLDCSDRRLIFGSWSWLLLFGILGVGALLYQPVDSASSATQLVSANPTKVAHSDSFYVAALGSHDVGRTMPTSLGATPSPQRPTFATRNIENIRVGDRVLAENPEITAMERAGWEEPEWASWLKLSLLMPKSDGSELHIQLLRPDSWFISQSRFIVAEPLFNCVLAPNEAANEEPATTGTFIPLRPVYRHFASQMALAESLGLQPIGFAVEMDLPELGLTGDAIVLNVETSPPVDDGAGSVVTATFHHSSGDVIDLVIANDTGDHESIGTTRNHPFWSVDRQKYVQAGMLELGERVLTYLGDTKRVATKLARPGPEPVYNLEVYGEHVYYVGDQGILAHNLYGTRIEMGEGLSGRAIAYRKQQKLFTGQNVSVIEYTSRSGQVRRVYGISGGLHAERKAFAKLPDYVKQNPKQHIREIFTELSPCTDGQKCSTWLRMNAPGVSVTYTSPYNSKASGLRTKQMSRHKQLQNAHNVGSQARRALQE